MTWEIRNMIEDIITQINSYVIFLLYQNWNLSVVILSVKWKKTFSTKFSLECRGAQASISLERKSRLATSCHTRSEGGKNTKMIYPRKVEGLSEGRN